MQLTVQGKQIDVGDALREHITDKLEDLKDKYFTHAAFATVTLSKEGHGHGVIRSHALIQVGKNITIVAENTDPDAYASFDGAAEKLGKQMRRYKKRLRDHHDRLDQTPETEILKAKYYTLASTSENESPEEQEDLSDEPLIIAEMATNIQTMSVSDAVMRMDLAGSNALVFKNIKNSELSLVYRRADGNIGWVDLSSQAEQCKVKSA
jgi:ribosomal subunit interface protein